MDKSQLRSRLLDLIRGQLPQFERAARVTCLLSVRLDGADESALFLDIVEDVPSPARSPARAPPPPPPQQQPEKSKRKSQAPQRMVANGEDSFVAAAGSPPLLPPPPPPLPASVSLGIGLGASSSSSFLNASSANGDSAASEQVVNLSGSSHAASTPLKSAGGSGGRFGVGFYLNNPGFPHHQQHFLLPGGILAASVFPTPTAVFQPAPPPAAVSPPAGAAASEDADRKPSALDGSEFLPKLPILPASGSSGQNPQQRPRSLFGLRSRRGGHKSFPCNQCQETFGSLAGLSKHTLTSHKGYKCTFCSANFTQRSNLQRHSLKHVGFKPFACRCCQKSYYRKDHLVRHIEVTHPGKEPKKHIETKLSSAECLEFLERKYESGEYSIALDQDGDEEMPDAEADGAAPPDTAAGDEGEMLLPDALEDEEDDEEPEEVEDDNPEAPAGESNEDAAAEEEPAALAAPSQQEPQDQPQQQPQSRRRPLRRQVATTTCDGNPSGPQLPVPTKANA